MMTDLSAPPEAKRSPARRSDIRLIFESFARIPTVFRAGETVDGVLVAFECLNERTVACVVNLRESAVNVRCTLSWATLLTTTRLPAATYT